MDKNTRTLVWVFAIVIGMAGLSFASVPLYTLFCRVTGFGGTPKIGGAAPAAILDREITIKFNADTSPALAWDFKPEQRSVKLPIGREGLIAYRATNMAGQVSTGTAVYNVTPERAAKYFHKTECFCFGEQQLGPKQDASLPVVFYVDPALAQDRELDDLKVITLSYTFFPADSKELEGALERFYNSGEAVIKGSTKAQ